MDKVRITRAIKVSSVILVITLSYFIMNGTLQHFRTVDFLQILGIGMLLGVLIQNIFLYLRLPASDSAIKGKT